METKRNDKSTYPTQSRNNYGNLKGGVYNAIVACK